MLKRSLLPIIIILAFISCGEKRYPSELVMADSAYMRGDYKRADSLLDVYIVNSSVNNDEDSYAYSRLLCLCKKFVRSGITGSDLPLADSLSSYFKNHGAIRKYGLSCIFLGNAFQKGEDYPSAMECYLTSRQISMELNDSVMLGWVEKAIGNLYFDQRMLDKCIPYYQHCYEIAHAMKDTLRMAQTSYKMALVSTIKSDADSAIYFYEKTIDLGQNSQLASLILSAAKQQISDIYIQVEEYGNALKYMSRDSMNSANWGYFHYGQHHLDSAAFYFKEVYENEKLRGRADMLFMLSAIEEEKGNVVNALGYLQRYVSTLDSLQAQTRTEETMRVQAQFNYNNINTKLQKTVHENEKLTNTLIIILFVIIVLLLISLIVFKEYHHKKSSELERERLFRMEEQRKYMQSVDRIEENNKRIAVLEKQLSEALDNHDLNAIERIKLDKAWLYSENESIQKIQERNIALRNLLLNSNVYCNITRSKDNCDIRMSDNDWKELERLIDDVYDGFTSRLLTICNLSEIELRTCYLIKVGVPLKNIAQILCLSLQGVSMTRSRLYEKILKKKGSAPEFDNFIKNF